MAGVGPLIWLFRLLIIGEVFVDAKNITDSVVKCDLSSISKSSFESVRVAAHAASKADAALCGNNTNAEAVAESTALAISTTFADAFLGSIVDCYAEGYAHYTINGHSLATAQAWAFAEAFAEASAVAKTCHKCLAASELLAHSYAEVFITAAKETEVYVSGVASGDHDRDEDDYTLIARDLVEKTMVAFAQVIVKARSKVKECQAAAILRVATGDENDLNKVECHVNAAAASDYRVQDAVRVSSEELALSVCDLEDRSTHVLEVEAEAVAKAFAIAVSGISAECTIEGQGTACAVGLSEITQAAEAVAEAYAVAFVSATAECDELCHTEEADLSAAIGSVLVTASSNIYKYNCTGPDSYFQIQAFEVDIVESSVTAISQLLAQATVATNDDRTTVCMVDMEFASAIEPEEPAALFRTAAQSPASAPAGLAVAQPMQAAQSEIVPASAAGPQPPADAVDTEEFVSSRSAGPVEPGISAVDQAAVEAAAPTPLPDPMPAPAPSPVEVTAELPPAPAPELAGASSLRSGDATISEAGSGIMTAAAPAPEAAAAGVAEHVQPQVLVPAADEEQPVVNEPRPDAETGSASSSSISGDAPRAATISEAGAGTQGAAAAAPDAVAAGGVAGHVPPEVPVPAAAEDKPVIDQPRPDAAAVSASKTANAHDVEVSVVTSTGTSVDGQLASVTPHKPPQPHPPAPASHAAPKATAKPAAAVNKPKPESPRKPPLAVSGPVHPESQSDPTSSPPVQRKPVTRHRPHRSPSKQHSKRHGHKRRPQARNTKRRPSTAQTRRRKAQSPRRPHRGPKTSTPKFRRPSKTRRGQPGKPHMPFKRPVPAHKRQRQKVMSKRQPTRPRRRVSRDRRSRTGRKTSLPRRLPRRSSRQPQKKTHKKAAGGARRKRRPRAARRTRAKRRGQ